ncbi:MAG: FtsQ-type POTRA domain-containing protein [Clostridia bacterium]|nr:FtsQ-type POTRA domain-containing protein [Clostridia bacterium]
MAAQKKNNSSKVIKLPTEFTGINGQQLSRDEIRSRKKRKLKRRRAIRKAMLSMFMFFVIAIIGVVLAFTVFFKIDTIKVKGGGTYPPKIVLQNCGVTEGDSLLLANSSGVAETLLSSLPYIGSVSVTRELPSTLIINVTDTACAAAIANTGTYILINEDGKVLDADADILNEGIPLVSGVEAESFKECEKITFKTKENGDILIEILKASTEAGMTGLTEIDVTNASDITMKYDNRIKIRVGSSLNLKNKVLRAASAIERENEINQYETGVLDLRTEPRAYFKAGAEETTSASKNKNNKTKTEKTQKK